MKKSHKIFLSVLFCFLVALPIATSFLWQGNSIEFSSEISKISTPKIDDNKREGESEENTTWTTPNFKTYADYFTDLNITAETITNEDYTGEGTLSNPYVVHSTRGFLYLSNNTLSKKSLNDAYVEINCDIILNDEYFDEDGVPHGGDGDIYQWKPISTGTNASIQGNDFHIKGLYYNDDEQVSSNTCKGLFGNVSLQEISNLVCEKFFINSYINTYLLARQITTCKNIILKDGTIKNYSAISGIANNCKYLLNCTNYANIISSTDSSGSKNGGLIGSTNANGVVENCKNYGNVVGCDQTGGIVGLISSGVTIENCQNFGFVKGRYHVGGIAGYSKVTTNRSIIKNCQNYGKITTVASSVAGICGAFEGVLQILSCGNYGYVYRTNYMKYCGEIIFTSNIENCSLFIKDTIAKSNSGIPFLGIGSSSKDNFTVKIKNCKIVYDDIVPSINSIICQESWMLANIDVDGFSIDFYGETFNLRLFGYFDPGSSISMKNIVFNINCQKNSTTNYIKQKQESVMVVSVGEIVINNNEAGVHKNYYYGSDFSGYCSDFKTGEIGLKVFSGKGFYQGKVTEDLLIEKGYQKKTF